MDKNNTTKKPFNYNYISVVLLYVWALIFIIEAYRNITDSGSKIFPYFVGGFAIFLATVLLIKSKFNIGKQETFDFSGSKKSIIYGIILVVYVALVATIGFYIATPIYLYFGMWMLGQRNKKVMISVSLALPLAVFLFFDLLLGMKIPAGILFS